MAAPPPPTRAPTSRASPLRTAAARRGRGRPGAFLVVASLALLAFGIGPASAEHPQSSTESGTGETHSVQFDHDGDNEWWVEVQVRGLEGDSIVGVMARAEGDGVWHSLQAQSNDWERQQQGWSKFASSRPYDRMHVPPGERVQFRASVVDHVTRDQGEVTSCWFTHPAGVEQCSDTTTTFHAPFTGFRGNEWWVQANVGTNGPAIAKVDVRKDGGPWMPLGKQSWGPTAWAGSYHFPQGSVLQMRATATDGRVDVSSCRQWIPPSGQDAAVVACPWEGFDATFSDVKGNEWWAQVKVTGNMPVKAVELRTGCEPSKSAWKPLTLQSWGSWAASYHLPAGTKVEFRALTDGGLSEMSGAYLWTAATPTSSC